MAKKNVFLHFLSNYIVVLLLFFTLFVMGPSEIFFGNYKEFGFVYQEFGWKFLIFAFLISFIFTLVISFFPDKLGKYILSVFWGIGIAGYIQTMFLNRHLEQMGARAEAYTASPSKIIVNSIIWATIIFAVCKISTEYLQKSNVNILSHYSGDAMCWIHFTFPLRR